MCVEICAARNTGVRPDFRAPFPTTVHRRQVPGIFSMCEEQISYPTRIWVVVVIVKECNVLIGRKRVF